MDETQIINDILNQLYNYTAIFNGSDTDLIKKKKIEKNEKQEELLNQINLMCSMLEKELRKELGEAFFEVKKGLRTFVFDAIQKEVKNGNNIISSDGKINLRKFSTMIVAQKNEFINAKRGNITNKEVLTENNSEDIKYKEEEILKLSDSLKEIGVELSNDDVNEVYEAIAELDILLGEIKSRKALGMTNEEIYNDLLKTYPDGKLDVLLNQYDIVMKLNDIQSLNNKDINDSTQNPTNLDSSEPTQTKGELLSQASEKTAQTESSQKTSSITLEEELKNGKGTIDLGSRKNVAIDLNRFLDPDLKEIFEVHEKRVEEQKNSPKAAKRQEEITKEPLNQEEITKEIVNNEIKEDYLEKIYKTTKLFKKLNNEFEKMHAYNYDHDSIEDLLLQKLNKDGEEIDTSATELSQMPENLNLTNDLIVSKINFDSHIHQHNKLNEEERGIQSERIIGIWGVSGVKDYLNKHLTKELAEDGTKILGQAAKDGVIAERTGSDKKQDFTETQTSDSGPGEPEDEVK